MQGNGENFVEIKRKRKIAPIYTALDLWFIL